MKIVQDRVRDSTHARCAAGGAYPAAHVLFASRDAGSAGEGDSGAGRAQDLKTTQRYMHLSPAAIEGAIRLLDASRTGTAFGNMLATGSTESANVTR